MKNNQKLPIHAQRAYNEDQFKSMISDYVNKLLLELATGNAQEHSYRPALKSLFESLDPSIRAVNEPSRSAHGAPDFAFYKSTNNSLVLGYVETKDINVNLDAVEKSEQLKRYLGYANLILTNYVEFRFFRNGEKYQTITIGKPNNAVIETFPQNFGQLERELKAFLDSKPQTITSAIRLAEIMGGKAARVRDNVINYLNSEDERNQELLRIYKVMQELLVHDLTPEKFADMYAQTLVYGLFVARYYDETPEDFTRQEARDLIPASNPFLQHFFDHIAGASFDKRLTYIVDELCDVFAVSAVRETVSQHYNLFGEAVDKDPVIHFYEDFLKEYDPVLRKNMGAYYTPVPVVQFIIRAVDDILKSEFNLTQGLADTTKIEQKIMQQGTKAKQYVHKVQVLDPAVGTATFLNETVKYIYSKFKGQEGVWESYVENELLPRLHGFELMMAPYTIAHLKLAMTLRETGIDHFDRRVGVYLTNTLEEGIKAQESLFGIGFGESIAEESRQAAEIKSNKPIMVVIGNPPYSVSSSNKNPWILNLIKDYKKDLNERKINLDDDYIKFIRFSEFMIEKNKSGIIAMITNNSFIDGLTHRQMRKHLLETFDDIYILDLHGNSKKFETASDGSKDENVFDIQQGVSIQIFIRKNINKSHLANVYHSEIYAKRNIKFNFLNKNCISDIDWTKLRSSEPFFFFVPKNFDLLAEYNKGFRIDEIASNYNSGIQTKNDKLTIHFEKDILHTIHEDFLNLKVSELTSKYHLKDSPGWKIENAKKSIIEGKSTIADIQYRVFDFRKILYTNKSGGFIGRPREKISKHFIQHNNIGILARKNTPPVDFTHIFVSKYIVSEGVLGVDPNGREYLFPLYLYLDDGTRIVNINNEIKERLEKTIGKIIPENIFDYIYVILHSRKYREKYKEFLKIDFPRIPYPKNKNSFRELVVLGNKLRTLHLMEDPELEKLATTYTVSGENLVEKVEFRGNNVFINETQFFGNVPKDAWEFYIGGYQPAQKWLKDRKGRRLTYEDINHYQKIIKVLTETIKIMAEIDEVVKKYELF